jgi:hypothetical protein
MKVEQRIDRIGQRYAKVRIVNLAYKDIVEADVYFSLGNRINWFEGVIGKLQPILSRLPKEFERVTLERKENREAAQSSSVIAFPSFSPPLPTLVLPIARSQQSGTRQQVRQFVLLPHAGVEGI